MTHTLLEARLKEIAARSHRTQLFWAWAISLGATAAIAGLFFWYCRSHGKPVPPLATGFLVLLTLGIRFVLSLKRPARTLTLPGVGKALAAENPEVGALLMTAAEQVPTSDGQTLNYLQSRVIEEAFLTSRTFDWAKRPAERLLLAQVCTILAALAFLLAEFGLWRVSASPSHLHWGDGKGISVTPGDTEAERGTIVPVLAHLVPPLPTEVRLVVSDGGKTVATVPLAKSLDDPIFGGNIPEVQTNLTYHVEYGRERSREFKVQVFDFPALQKANAEVVYPTYTGIPSKHIEDTRRVSAVEGSSLNFQFLLNKPVSKAQLVAKDKSSLALEPVPGYSNLYQAAIKLDASKKYELQLLDADGRSNKVTSEFVFDALKNRRPDLVLKTPRGDQRVSALQEVNIEGEASDDYGLLSHGVAISLPGQEPQLFETGKSAPAREKRALKHFLALESMNMQPGQFITYHLWADDYGPQGEVRRTSSDMYFAEIRPFEEIFRQGEDGNAPSGESEQAGKGGAAQNLLKLQKEIMNATWRLQRDESGTTLSPGYSKDAGVVRESQEQALSKLDDMMQKSENPKVEEIGAKIEKAMKKAVAELKSAEKSTKPLPLALAAEQEAYQGLLQLQAREHRVTNSKNQPGSGAESQDQQRQLDELDLKTSENRYETARQAAPKQKAAQQEETQILNRLKELARRQNDVNDRLKELQTALQEAKTDEEKENVRKQLKRLRDEQRQLVQDMDEVRQKMTQAQNAQQMSDSLSKLDETRAQAQQAAKKLEEGSVSQGLAAGRKTQQDLEQLKEEFKKKTSNQFADEMKQMRNDARQLAQKEEELSKKIDQMANGPRKTLTDNGERKEAASALEDQKKKLDNLVENMRRTSELSEEAEPLLSRQLYDTIRQTSQEDSGKDLTQTKEWLNRGLFRQASQFEERARRNIDRIKAGVEKAAESVVGDETESLKFAKRQLDELTDQLEKEIARNGGTNGVAGGSGEQASSTNRLAAAGGRQPGESPGDQAGGQRAEGQRSQPGDQPGQGEQPGQGPGQGQQQQAQAGQGGQGQGQGQQPGQGQGQPQQAQAGQGQGQQGQQPGQGQGQQPGQGRGQGQQQQAQAGQRGQGQQPGQGQGQGQGQQPGQRQGQGQGQGQQQAQAGQRGQGQGQGQGQGGRGNRPATRPNLRAGGGGGGGGDQRFEAGRDGGMRGQEGPIAGNDYTNWADQLRDVQDMVDMPDLQNQIASIRDRARAVRSEVKKENAQPKWDLVYNQILTPLVEVRKRVAEELLKRENPDALVPIDRDPVPAKYSELVRKYYEDLGKK